MISHVTDLEPVASAVPNRRSRPFGSLRRLAGWAVLAVACIAGVSVGIGYAPAGGFEWTVFALVFTALSTLVLALSTGALALSTWQDVRETTRLADAAVAANNAEAVERERRPDLSLLPDADKLHSRVEVDGELIVRLLVTNVPGRRAAIGTRVLVDRCRAPDNTIITFGSPALGWSSAAAREHDEAVVIFAGSSRVVDLGTLIREGSDDVFIFTGQSGARSELKPWIMRIELPLVDPPLPDGREHVGTGTKIRLVVGSDESDAKLYDVGVYWQDTAQGTESLLNSLSVVIDEVLPGS
jgi:hypothetical protein